MEVPAPERRLAAVQPTPAPASSATSPADLANILATAAQFTLRWYDRLAGSAGGPEPKEIAALRGAYGIWAREQKQATDAIVVPAVEVEP